MSTLKRVAILWGSSSAYGVDRSGKFSHYKKALDLIENGAKDYGYAPVLVLYPGHPDRNGVTNGSLSFRSALRETIEQCKDIQPDWILGRSLGATVALAALGSRENWTLHCKGATIWGPVFKRNLDSLYPDDTSRLRAIQDYEKFGTILASNFFETLPDVEPLINSAAGNLRIARGSEDNYNTTDELYKLANTHSSAQPEFMREVRVVEGAPHTPIQSRLTQKQISAYLNCLFTPLDHC